MKSSGNRSRLRVIEHDLLAAQEVNLRSDPFNRYQALRPHLGHGHTVAITGVGIKTGQTQDHTRSGDCKAAACSASAMNPKYSGVHLDAASASDDFLGALL